MLVISKITKFRNIFSKRRVCYNFSPCSFHLLLLCAPLCKQLPPCSSNPILAGTKEARELFAAEKKSSLKRKRTPYIATCRVQDPLQSSENFPAFSSKRSREETMKSCRRFRWTIIVTPVSLLSVIAAHTLYERWNAATTEKIRRCNVVL